MLILFWVCMLFWLVGEIYGAWPAKDSSSRIPSISSGIIAWIAVAFLALLTVGFPK